MPADPQALHQEAREQDEAQQPDDDRVLRLPPVPGQLGRGGAEAAEDRHPNAHEPDQPEQVAHEAVGQVQAPFEEGVLASNLEDQREVVVDRQQDRHQRQHGEAGVDAEVHHARVAVVIHAGGARSQRERVRDPRPQVGEDVHPATEPPHPQALHERPHDDRHGHAEDEVHHGEALDVEEHLAAGPLRLRRLQRADSCDDRHGNRDPHHAHIEARAPGLTRVLHGRWLLLRGRRGAHTLSFVGEPYSLRRSFFSTLPMALRGSSSTTAMYCGALNEAIRVLQ